MVSALGQAYAGDVRMRTGGNPDSTTLMLGADVPPGVVYERDGVKVTAFAVDHDTPPIPAYGYRVDFAGRSVVISGDTRLSENLIRAASGVDLIIHEVMAATAEAAAAPAFQRILASHTSPEDAGRVFARARPKLAVFTHVSLVAAPERRAELLESLISRTRATYDGPVVVGEDLMTIIVGESVEVQRPPWLTPP
jgi:ribonuclease Z